MYTFTYKSSDYTLQSNNSTIKTILLLKYPTSVTALVSRYKKTHGGVSSEKLDVDIIPGQLEGLQKHQSACKILVKYSPK